MFPQGRRRAQAARIIAVCLGRSAMANELMTDLRGIFILRVYFGVPCIKAGTYRTVYGIRAIPAAVTGCPSRRCGLSLPWPTGVVTIAIPVAEPSENHASGHH